MDPEEDAVDVWRFGEEAARHERFTGTLPVKADGEVVGEIELDEVFARAG